MDAADGKREEIPTASLVGAGVPLSYSHEIAGEMPWVLRFVGCFILCQGLLPLLSFLPDLGQLGRSMLSWRDGLGMLGVALVALAGVGVLMRWRVALWLAMALCLLQGFAYFVMLPRASVGRLWLGQLPPAMVKAVLLWLVWRRAERAGVLVPVRPEKSLNPAPGDDVLWLVRRLGIYLLLPSATLALWIAVSPQGLFTDFPTNAAISVCAAALGLAVAIGLMLGWYRLLAVWAAIALVAPVASSLAFQWDFAHDARFKGSMPAGSLLFSMIRGLTNGTVTAGLYLILYRRARGRTPATCATADRPGQPH